jgi:hypothetical protein
MRRRLRRQRQVREALLLDLGALVFELHRQGRREPELLQAKAAELTAVDEEVRALSATLEVQGTMLELTAAGIAGSCSQCGAIMPLGARFCSSCGSSQQVALSPGAPDPDLAALAAAQAPVVSEETPPLPPSEDEDPVELGTEERAALEAGELERVPDEPGPPVGEGDTALEEPLSEEGATEAWSALEALPPEEEPVPGQQTAVLPSDDAAGEPSDPEDPSHETDDRPEDARTWPRRRRGL